MIVHFPRFMSLLFFLVVVSSQPFPAGADEDELPFDVFVMPPEPIAGVDVRWTDLFGEAAQAPQVRRTHGPYHGDLALTAEGFYYSAQPSLWEAGVDSFVFDYYYDAATRKAMNVVITVGEAHRGIPEANTFDDPEADDWAVYDPAGSIRIEGSALWVTPSGTEAGYVYYVLQGTGPAPPTSDLYDGPTSHPGSSTTGTGCGVLLDPPPESVPPALPDVGAGQVFYAAGPVALADSVKARVRRGGDGFQAKVEAVDRFGTWHESAWVDLPSDKPAWLEVEYDYLPNALEVVRLNVDGELAVTTPAFDGGEQPLDLDEHRIGVMEAPAGGGVGLRIELAEIYRYKIHGDEEPERTDDFETGTLTGWNHSAGSGLSPVELATAGRIWMEGDLASGNSYLADSTPTAASYARLRFDVDADAVDSPFVKVLAAHSDDAWTGANEHLHVLLRRTDAEGPQVEVRIKDTVWHTTGWQPLPEASANRVELTFRAASAAGLADGQLRVRIDGVELPAIDGVANDQNLVETVRFGIMGLGSGLGRSGQVYLDNFQLWVPHESCESPCNQ